MGVSSLYGRVYRSSVDCITIINSFLPVREGVSVAVFLLPFFFTFPPCTGGCIGQFYNFKLDMVSFLPVREGVSLGWCSDTILSAVSSLYGRVYHDDRAPALIIECFLPVREGVSPILNVKGNVIPFPPCTGGCIMWRYPPRICQAVFSLYGRVYRDTKRPD